MWLFIYKTIDEIVILANVFYSVWIQEMAIRRLRLERKKVNFFRRLLE